MELELNNDEKVYIKPTIYIIKVNMPHLMAASSKSTMHNSNTGRDSLVDMVAGDDKRAGDDDISDAAKRWEFNFDEF